MGVTDDVLGDAAQDSASQGALAPAADHYDAHAELLAEVDDLLGRTAEAEVGFGDPAARGPDALHLLFEQPLGIALELDRLLLGVSKERRYVLANVDDV